MFVRKNLIFLATLTSLIITSVSFAFHPKTVYAVAGVNPGGLSTGGTITAMTVCTCGYTSWLGAMYLVVKGKDATKSGTYVFSALLTELHSNWMVRPGSGMLATYIPGVQMCWMQAGYVCVPYPNRGLLTSIGVGLTP